MSYSKLRAAAGIAAVTMLLASSCFAKTIEAIGSYCQAGSDKACIELRKIATKAKSPKDRIAAIAFISDKSVLSEIANDVEQEQDVRDAAGSLLAALDKQEAEQKRKANEKYVMYSNGFAIPQDASINPFNEGDVYKFWTARPSELWHQSEEGIVRVEGWAGFSGSVLVAGVKYEVSGTAVTLPSGRMPGTTLEFAYVSANTTILRAPSGRGVLVLNVGTTEWLLPDFDLQAATSVKGYVYKGRVIQFTEN
jgi:hypothetical protein